VKTKRQLINLILIFPGPFAASSALAQKGKADISPAITTPDSVETRLKLVFFRRSGDQPAPIAKRAYAGISFS
jgi:hypothetical protein